MISWIFALGWAVWRSFVFLCVVWLVQAGCGWFWITGFVVVSRFGFSGLWVFGFSFRWVLPVRVVGRCSYDGFWIVIVGVVM